MRGRTTPLGWIRRRTDSGWVFGATYILIQRRIVSQRTFITYTHDWDLWLQGVRFEIIRPSSEVYYLPAFRTYSLVHMNCFHRSCLGYRHPTDQRLRAQFHAYIDQTTRCFLRPRIYWSRIAHERKLCAQLLDECDLCLTSQYRLAARPSYRVALPAACRLFYTLFTRRCVCSLHKNLYIV